MKISIFYIIDVPNKILPNNIVINILKSIQCIRSDQTIRLNTQCSLKILKHQSQSKTNTQNKKALRFLSKPYFPTGCGGRI